MAVPVSQMWTVASYVLKQRYIKRKKRYPLVLMLEPLFRCNLSCAGCGKIQYPSQVLKTQLTAEECFKAVDECGTPMVSIPGGEPLMHPEIDKIVAGLLERKKYVYLCTNALLLEEKIHLFKPSKYLSFSIHLDGLEKEHDFAVCREGTYEKALSAAKLAVSKGFRVTTNTTLFDSADPERTHRFFDTMMDVGVEGMMLSPGYSYSKAPDKENFLKQRRIHNLFRRLLKGGKRTWKFNHSPLFLEFLSGGHQDYECTPWGNPSYSVFGWQKPCYLLQEGYAETFQELLDDTAWENYGRLSGNDKCKDCMVHCGYEPTAVDKTFGSWAGFWGTVKATFRGPQIEAPTADTVEDGSGDEAYEDIYKQGFEFLSMSDDKSDLRPVIDAAFDYRGDVTLMLENGDQTEGYIFNRDNEKIEIWLKNQNQRGELSIDSIRGVNFSGKDTAEGKSWEAWVKRYEEKHGKFHQH